MVIFSYGFASGNGDILGKGDGSGHGNNKGYLNGSNHFSTTSHFFDRGDGRIYGNGGEENFSLNPNIKLKNYNDGYMDGTGKIY